MIYPWIDLWRPWQSEKLNQFFYGFEVSLYELEVIVSLPEKETVNVI